MTNAAPNSNHPITLALPAPSFEGSAFCEGCKPAAKFNDSRTCKRCLLTPIIPALTRPPGEEGIPVPWSDLLECTPHSGPVWKTTVTKPVAFSIFPFSPFGTGHLPGPGETGRETFAQGLVHPFVLTGPATRSIVQTLPRQHSPRDPAIAQDAFCATQHFPGDKDSYSVFRPPAGRKGEAYEHEISAPVTHCFQPSRDKESTVAYCRRIARQCLHESQPGTCLGSLNEQADRRHLVRRSPH